MIILQVIVQTSSIVLFAGFSRDVYLDFNFPSSRIFFKFFVTNGKSVPLPKGYSHYDLMWGGSRQGKGGPKSEKILGNVLKS